MDVQVEFRVLGTLELRGPGGEEVSSVLAQPKRVAILTYLALAEPRGWHQRDELLGIFWPERDKHHAQTALRNSLHFLKRQLGEGLVLRRGSEVSLAPSGLWCDAVAFEGELNRGDLEAAVALYRGDLLASFHVGGAPDFERWLELERARLAGLFEEAVESLSERAIARRRWRDGIRWWQLLARRDEYNSRYVLKLMEALVMAGEPANAIRVAEEHERFLQEDLGAEPPLEVLELAKRLHSNGSG
jgi:DNA-binding SARP family transcriptional activator